MRGGGLSKVAHLRRSRAGWCSGGQRTFSIWCFRITLCFSWDSYTCETPFWGHGGVEGIREVMSGQVRIWDLAKGYVGSAPEAPEPSMCLSAPGPSGAPQPRSPHTQQHGCFWKTAVPEMSANQSSLFSLTAARSRTNV